MSPFSSIDNGLNQLPFLWKAISIVGFPIVLALILVLAFMAERYGWVEDTRGKQLELLIAAHSQIMLLAANNNRILLENQRHIGSYGDQANGMSLAICLNVAVSEEPRHRCLEALRAKGGGK